ncbi:amidohydrolase [Archaeoglobales archaeon]|nr:MAG: amidohydrolase [Archaeoglobales archaeon]
MVTIDFHMHIYEEPWHSWVIEFLEKINPSLDYTKPVKPEYLLRDMDEAGIEYGVIFAESTPQVTGIVSNEFVSNFCSKSDRLIPFASVNPNLSPDPAGDLEYCVKELGMRGLKLLPSYMYFYPNEKRVYSLYEKAVELKIPVIFHTGTSVFKNVRQKYADPLYLDDVAVDFPELKIIMAHSGRGWWYDTASMLARIHENVYLEISGLPPKKLLDYFPNLDNLSDKVIFGSDWPGCRLEKLVEDIKNLSISEEAIRKILGENAAKILGLKNTKDF